MEEILRRILSIEAEARAIVSEAQELATMLKEQTKGEVDEILAQAQEKAKREAEALEEKAREVERAERARRLAAERYDLSLIHI